MTKTIENLFYYTSTYSTLIPILFFLIFIQKCKKEKILKIVFYYSCILFLTDTATFFLSMKAVIFSYFIFTNIEYLLFSSLFYILITNTQLKKIIIISNAAFIIFSITYFMIVGNHALDSIPIGVETIFILFFAFFYLYEQMESTSQTLIYDRYAFWFVAGIMIYLAGSFFIYIFSNQVDKETRYLYWMFTNLFTIVKNILFAIGILIYKKTIIK